MRRGKCEFKTDWVVPGENSTINDSYANPIEEKLDSVLVAGLTR